MITEVNHKIGCFVFQCGIYGNKASLTNEHKFYCYYYYYYYYYYNYYSCYCYTIPMMKAGVLNILISSNWILKS